MTQDNKNSGEAPKEQEKTPTPDPVVQVPEQKEQTKPLVKRVMADTQSKSILNITNLFTLAILILLVLFLVRIGSVFGIFAFSFVIAFLLFPTVEWLADRRVPRVWAILIVFIVIGGILVGLGAAIVPAVIAQSNALLEQLPQISERWQEDITRGLERFQVWLESQGVQQEDIQEYLSGVIPTIQEWGINFGQRIASGIQNAVGGIVTLFTVPIIVFYLLLDAPRIRDSLIGLAPRRTGNEIQNILNRLAAMLNHYLRGQLKLSFLMFLITTVFLYIFGVRHALLLGVLAGITEVIPIVGPIIALVPALLVSYFIPSNFGILSLPLFDYGWARALAIFAFYMALQYVEGNILVPRIMGKDLNLHPLTVMFALLVGGYLAGIFGMLLSLPIAASLKVIFEIYYPTFIQRVEDLISRVPMQSRESDAGK